MSKRAKILMLLGLLSGLALVCCCIFLFVMAASSANDVSGQEIRSGRRDETIAVIDIDEVITGTAPTDFFGNSQVDMASRAINQLRSAKEDENVKAVILRINTPGGEVYATKQIYNEILAIQDAQKPVVVLMQDQAASGGYYLSAPADYIVASEMTLTGSIGVKFQLLDTSGLYEKLGLRTIEISNSDGDLKVTSPDDLLDKESEAYKQLQSVVDDYHTNFVDVVAAGRSMSDVEVRGLADGRIYSGRQALELNLIDELGEFEAAAKKAVELAGLSNPRFVRLDNNRSGIGTYGMSIFNILNPAEAALNTIDSQSEFKVMYKLSL